MGDVIDGRVNWEILREVNQADPTTKHFMGTMRCCKCGTESKVMMPAPLWAAAPPSGLCDQDGCDGILLYIHPDEPTDGEPFEYLIVDPRNM